ncbi:hypothetical protein Aduo_008557 [Ancylostoma duodenale]
MTSGERAPFPRCPKEMLKKNLHPHLKNMRKFSMAACVAPWTCKVDMCHHAKRKFLTTACWPPTAWNIMPKIVPAGLHSADQTFSDRELFGLEPCLRTN